MLLKNDIFDIIQNNNITFKEELNKRFMNIKIYINFPDQIDCIKSMILEFEEKHLNVNSFYQKYKSDPYIIFNKILTLTPRENTN